MWEGSGNVIALDVVRALSRAPESLEAVLAEIDLAAGTDRRLDGVILEIKKLLTGLQDVEANARRLVEGLALVLQASLVVRYGSTVTADAFLSSRFGSGRGRTFGTLPGGFDFRAIIHHAEVA